MTVLAPGGTPEPAGRKARETVIGWTPVGGEQMSGDGETNQHRGFGLRAAAESDLGRLSEIAGADLQNSWSGAAFAEELALDWSRIVVLTSVEENAEEVVGFIVYWLVADEVQVLNVGVCPQWRRRGGARVLVERVVSEARQRGAAWAYLEVRSGNGPAMRLYETLGFCATGRRPGYYSQSGEDAVLMALSLEGGECA